MYKGQDSSVLNNNVAHPDICQVWHFTCIWKTHNFNVQSLVYQSGVRHVHVQVKICSDLFKTFWFTATFCRKWQYWQSEIKNKLCSTLTCCILTTPVFNHSLIFLSQLYICVRFFEIVFLYFIIFAKIFLEIFRKNLNKNYKIQKYNLKKSNTYMYIQLWHFSYFV